MLFGNKEREALQSGEKIFILVFHMGLHPCEQRISISINKMHIQGITRALKFTPDIKFVNDETLNEFVVTVERRNVGETDAKNDRDSDRDDRDKLLNESDLDKINIKQNDRDDRDNEVEITHIAYKALNGTQKDIIQFCSIPRSAREILEHIGYSYHPTNINKFIKPLLEHGFIEMTEPEKLNSKNQKYRKVRKNYKQSICN